MIKDVRKVAVIAICAFIASCLIGCVEPVEEHTHEVQEVTTENVVGYAWEREYLRIWHNLSVLSTDIDGTYVLATNRFKETASFLVQREVDDKTENVFIQFDITDVDTYAEIMRHLYEPFNICIDDITYTDGCTTKQFRLIGLAETE